MRALEHADPDFSLPLCISFARIVVRQKCINPIRQMRGAFAAVSFLGSIPQY